MKFLDRLRGRGERNRLEEAAGRRRFFGRRKHQEDKQDQGVVINRAMRRRMGARSQRSLRAIAPWCERHEGRCVYLPRHFRRYMHIGRPTPLLKTRSN